MRRGPLEPSRSPGCGWSPSTADTGPESITQAIGRIAHSEGLQGLLVPSAAVPGEKNLVVFPDLLPPGHLVPMNPGRLPSKAEGS